MKTLSAKLELLSFINSQDNFKRKLRMVHGKWNLNLWQTDSDRPTNFSFQNNIFCMLVNIWTVKQHLPLKNYPWAEILASKKTTTLFEKKKEFFKTKKNVQERCCQAWLEQSRYEPKILQNVSNFLPIMQKMIRNCKILIYIPTGIARIRDSREFRFFDIFAFWKSEFVNNHVETPYKIIC